MSTPVRGSTSAASTNSLAVSDLRIAGQGRIDVRPLSEPFGAEVHAFDFSVPLFAEMVDEIESAIGQYLVLVFRGHTPPTDEQFTKFTTHFGVHDPKDLNPQFARPGNPYILVISNIVEDGKEVGGRGAVNLDWHTDGAHRLQSTRFGFLDAVEVPETGGNTLFASGYAALEALTPQQRAHIADLELLHMGPPADPNDPRPTSGEHTNAARRPITVVNPSTGRRALYLNNLRSRAADPTRQAEADSLLAHITSTRFILEHEWKVGDLVMWDELGLLHARREFDPSQRRYLRQVSVRMSDVAAPWPS
jgi:alpha-ketoglutarate-dependent taurine dioxygenase